MNKNVQYVVLGMGAALTMNATASVVTLDFEGLGSQAAVNNFYNGGTDSQGNSGTNYGVAFGPNSLALRESDPVANFSHEPSPQTILFFLTGSAILNYAPGFDTGFSFFYTTVSFSGVVDVYDGLNATGNLLGSINIAALGSGPDPANAFSNWEIGSLGFSGIAKSINFGGTVNQVGYDNVTFGSTNPRVNEIPEPTSLALSAIALTAMAWTRFKRKVG